MSAKRSVRKRKASRVWRWLLFLTVLAMCVLFAGLGWLLMVYPDRRGPGQGRAVNIELAQGKGLSAIAHDLAQQGALSNAQLFAFYARIRGAQGRLRKGTVLVYDTMSPDDIVKRIARGYGALQLRVVIPEGFSRFEIGARLARWGVCTQAAFLAATQDAALLRELGIEENTAEGWLFPDTYLLSDELDPRDLVRRFVQNARRRMDPVFDVEATGMQRLARELGWGRSQVLILASIVEREAALAEEQPIIAGVFLNRLRSADFKPKRLQADPTVLYGCVAVPSLASCRKGSITRQMLLDVNNPYNTYRIDGLPPGPIGNPGLGAIRAVLAPAKHDYFYFVALDRTRHAFSRTLNEHNAAVEQRRRP